MSLAHLARPVTEESQAEEHKKLYGPDHMRWEAIEYLRPKFGPSSPEWKAVVYFNPELYSNPTSFDIVSRHYTRIFPKREFLFEALRPEQLEERDLFRFPVAEEIFRRRGFVSDIEASDYGVGARDPKTIYLRRNRSAALFQLTIIDYVLHRSVLALSEASRHRTAVASLMGLVEGTAVALAEIEDLLLPRDALWRGDEVHMAYELPVRDAIAKGREDNYNLCRAVPEDIAEQVKFEHRHSRSLFGGATPSALLLWQTQSLAVLRKIAWWIDAQRGPSLYRQECVDTEEYEKALKKMRRDPSFLPKNPERPFIRNRNSIQDQYRERIDGHVKFIDKISTEHNIVAALHGATYIPDFDPSCEYDCAHPLNWLQPLAKWIGELKRRRHAVLDNRVASLLLAIGDKTDGEFDHPPLSAFAPVIEARIGTPAWTVIMECVSEMQRPDAMKAISVVYDWTRDPDEPWFAGRRDGVILVRGPLLDFPVHDVAHWNRKAVIVHKQGGVLNFDKTEKTPTSDETGVPAGAAS